MAATPKATGVGAHRQPADRRGVVGDHRQGGVGDERDAVGAAGGLLGVEEPGAARPRLERELAALEGVRQDVVAQRGERFGQRAAPSASRSNLSAASAVASGRCTRSSNLRIFTEPQQGATYDDLLAVAPRAEQLGFGAFFRSDHYLAMGPALEAGGLPGPTDAWTTLAGLARDTSTIRLGTLVTSATFRLPGPLAITVAGVDQMSGGRVELGLGAGWYEREHEAYAIPFPPLGERFDRLEEQLAVITGLWATPVGRAVRLRRSALPGRRLAGAAQAGAGRRHADHRRRRRADAHACARRPLRRRVQRSRSCRSSGSSSSATGASPRARRSGGTRRR